MTRQSKFHCESLESRTLLTTFTPMDGPALSNVLNGVTTVGGKSLQLGDTIILQAGNTYTGEFTLKNITAGSGQINIQSSNLASLPGPGQRVSPANAVNMPKLVSIGFNAPIVDTQAFAHNYQFTGVEFIGPANNSTLVTMVQFGDTTSAQTVDNVANHLNIDRCYFHPYTNTQQIRRAIALQDAYSDVTNSYIAEIHEGSDSNAIAGWNGVGHFNIINNHLEGAGENILFGGATNYMPGPITDVTIRGNHLIKPTSWRGVWTVKNLFELKQGANFDIEGNIFENCWVSGQTGVAILFKLGDYDVSPQNYTSDILFQNNIVRHANGGLTFQGRDYASNSPAGLVRRITVKNNVWDDISGTWSTGGTGSGTFFMYLTHGPQDITFDHNTCFNGYTSIEVDTINGTYPATDFRYTNNIVNHSLYGIRAADVGSGDPVFAEYFNEGTAAEAAARITNNAMVAGPNGYKYKTRVTWFPTTYDSVGFVDRANGDYHLLPTSPYHAGNADQATDGTDLGANITALNAATATAISGVTDVTPPTIVSRSFQNQTGPAYIEYTFSEPVSSLSNSSLTLTSLDTPGAATPTVASVQWISASNTARFILSNPIPDGNFRATLNGVHDPANNALAGSSNEDFYFLAGDANADRAVNALDFNALASHYGSNGAGFSGGDFNLDGKVDSADFAALSARWTKTMPAPALGAAQAPASLFSATSIQKPDVINDLSGVVT